VPVQSLFSASTTHVASLTELNRLDVLTGVSRLSDLRDTGVAHAARPGVREFAPNMVVDAELVVASRPGLFMTGGASSAALATVRAAGVPVVANIEWLESTALARAEWLKYVALFLNEERAAQAAYGGVAARYHALRERARAVPENVRPRVMTGRSARGTFTIAGGRSYVAALIADAGGRYVWADNTSTGSFDVDFEAQLVRAAQADIWINGGGWRNRGEMLQHEPRYAQFKAFRNGQVWVYERLDALDTANDYWSRSVTHPDLLLGDLVKIFLPAIAPAHTFEWYVQVPAR
jgi:iron complex transport system substrate-binding protein